MIVDTAPFSGTRTNASRTTSRSITAFFEFLERKLGVIIAYDKRNIPLGRPDLGPVLEVAGTLKDNGIIETFYPITRRGDDPPIKAWGARCADTFHTQTGGGSRESDADALMATLAEALERYLWKNVDDHFKNSFYASTQEMERQGRSIVAPKRFASFSANQRSENPQRMFTSQTPFLWTEGASLVSDKKVFIPAQTVSGVWPFHHEGAVLSEPLIRNRHTIGLATWPTQAGARLAGALECLEREAYMIMWLNQLTLPRVDISGIRAQNPAFSTFIDMCERYKFKIHVVSLLTDAPTYILLSVIEDTSGHQPRFSFGMKAHRSLAQAVEKSIIEGLRGNRRARYFLEQGVWDPQRGHERVGHDERVVYWARAEKAKELEFIIRGDMQELPKQVWDHDTIEEHLVRIVRWCQEKGFECVAVPLTHSAKNPTDLHVEMVVIPELQQLHLTEKDFSLGGERWQTVPHHFGIKPRSEMFTEEPHPHA